MTGEEVADTVGEEYKQGYGYVRIRCYNTSFHNNDDRDPSLVIYDGDRGYYCFACGVSGSHEWLMREFGMESRKPSEKRVIPPKEYKKYNFNGMVFDECTPREIEVMAKKGITSETLERLGWVHHTTQVPGWSEGIAIPYTFNGAIVGARLRLLDGAIRFKSLPGGESFPYLADYLKTPYVYVCEGETDTVTMVMNGYWAIGIPGATNMQAIKKAIALAKEHGTHLCVVPDRDKAGEDFANRIKDACFKEGIKLDRLDVPQGKDVNEWYNLVGQDEFRKHMDAKHTTGVLV